MTDPNTAAAPAPGAAPAAPTSVTIAPNSEMTFPTASPEGKAYTAKEQFQQRLKSPTWCKDALTAGTPAAADKYRLELAMAQEQARMMGEDFTLPDATPDADVTPPEAFQFPYGDSPPATPQDNQLDSDMRGWLSASGLDRDAGSRLAESVGKLAAKKWTDDALDAHIESGRAALKSVWRENYKANVELLDRLLGDIEKTAPGLNEFLDARPFVLTDPMVAQTLLNLAWRRYGVA